MIIRCMDKSGAPHFIEFSRFSDVKEAVTRQMTGHDAINQKHGAKEKTTWYNCPVSFDIETSYVDIDGDPKKRLSYLYMWQMGVNDTFFYGRTWEEWYQALYTIHTAFKAGKRRKIKIYVHNLAYEWAFFHGRLPIKRIFARKPREPLVVELGEELDGIVFADLYAVTGYSLEMSSKINAAVPFVKQKDLDYSVQRTSETPLTEDEMRYCLLDVVIPYYIVKDLIAAEKTHNVAQIPMTKTGFVRRLSRETFASSRQWREWFLSTRLDAIQYIHLVRAFRGGDTHAAGSWCNIPIDGVTGADITSSYPYQMISREFPISKPITVPNPTVESLKTLRTARKQFIVELEAVNVRVKDELSYTYISTANCLYFTRYNSKNPRRKDDPPDYAAENGRLLWAEKIRICVTNIDFEIIERYYDMTINGISHLHYYYKSGLLPEPWRRHVLYLYGQKTRLKGVAGAEAEAEYMRSKEGINSQYGMCVTSPLNDMVEWINDEWIVNAVPLDEAHLDVIQHDLDTFYKKRKSFLPYQIGVFITAWARYMLHELLDALNDEYPDQYPAVYWDTDSAYSAEDVAPVVRRLNDAILTRLREIGYNEDEMAPLDIMGNRHLIGAWDILHDGRKFRMRTYGAKKYIIDDGGDVSLTISGLGKQAAQYLVSKYADPIKALDHGEIFPEEWSGRTYSIYCDEPYALNVDGQQIIEMSGQSIVPTTYTLGDTLEHKMFVLAVQQLIKRKERDNND